MNDILIKIQSELKVPKNQFNNFGKYPYRSCEDILEAVKPLLKKYECLLTISDEILFIGERYYVVATAKIEKGDKYIAVMGNAREEENKKGMDASQITGSASSYARKYALNGLFAIDDSKDSDSTNRHEKESKPEQWAEESEKATKDRSSDIISEAQRKRLFAITKDLGVPDEYARKILGAYGYESSKEIKKKDYAKIVEEIESFGNVKEKFELE